MKFDDMYQAMDEYQRKQTELEIINSIIAGAINEDGELSICLHGIEDEVEQMIQSLIGDGGMSHIKINTNKQDFIAIAEILKAQLEVELGELVSELHNTKLEL